MTTDVLGLRQVNNHIYDAEDNLYYFNASKKPMFASFSDVRFYVQPVDYPEHMDHYVSFIWDCFQTSRVYINSKYFSKETVSSANDVLPFIYIVSITNNGQNLADSTYSDVMNHDIPNNTEIQLPLPGDSAIVFKRYIDEKYDGWVCALSNCFNNFAQDQENNQLISDNDSKDIDKLLKKITKKIKNQTAILDEAEKTINTLFQKEPKSNIAAKISNTQLQFDFSKNEVVFNSGNNIKNQEFNNMTSYPVCAHLSAKTESLDITSKDYAYANKPNNYASCSHPSMAKISGLTTCPYGIGPDHSHCSYYTPVSKTLCTYTSVDSVDGFSFSVIKKMDVQGNNIVDIYNSRNNQLSYSFSFPSDVTEEELFQEIDSIISEVVSSWPKEVVDTVNYHRIPEDEPLNTKKSFIMSLVQ